ncbi:hypothetical protein [Niveibacterium terrae]|uniref:hypothetical protein n=1 Tax=Niveibacterium terrae TaxID=3373598 RepID=UPI003A9575D8
MTDTDASPSANSTVDAPNREPADVGARVAAIYALVAHRLSAFYDHDHWITQAQGAALCNDWLMRSKKTLSQTERKQLSDLSEQIATQIRDSLSREAGLYTAHELMESLDPRYVSELGASIMDECLRVLKESDAR